jgi:VanZ family protein
MNSRAFHAPLIWMGVILFLSIIPGEDLPDFSFWKLLSVDKLVHAGFYMVLSFLILKGCVRQYRSPRIRTNGSIIAISVSTVYGGFMELLQELYLNDRYGDWMDIISNVIGAVAGVIVFRLIFFEYIR